MPALTSEQIAATADAIAAQLGIPRCISCRATISAPRNGGAGLCQLCTEREIGLCAAENAARIAAGLSVAAWLRRPPDEPYPNPKPSAFRRRVYGVAPPRDNSTTP